MKGVSGLSTRLLFMKPTFSNALYYPSIDILNSDWLKTAILFWDSISTIVPESISQPYVHPDTEYLNGIDFLRPIYVNPTDISVVGIEKRIMNIIDSIEGFNYLTGPMRYRSAKSNDLKKEMDRVGIYPEKLSNELQHYLKDKFGKILTSNGTTGDVFSYLFNENFADLYMSVLADEMCKNHSIAPVTDNFEIFNFSKSICFGNTVPISHEHSKSTHSADFERGLLLDLIISNLRISPDTDIGALVQFKEKYKDELGLFRTGLSKLVQGVSCDRSLEAIQQEVYNIYVNEFSPAYNNFKDALNGLKIKWFSDNALNVSSLLIDTTILDSPASSILLLKTGVQLLKSNISYIINKKKTLKENPYSYLLTIQNDFSHNEK